MVAWLETFLHSDAELVGILGAGFCASAFLPAGAEAFIGGVAATKPELAQLAMVTAAIGGAIGYLIPFCIGRAIPAASVLPQKAQRWLGVIRARGTPLLLFASVPWLGDALCMAAGWSRLNFLRASMFILLSTTARAWMMTHAARGLLH